MKMILVILFFSLGSFCLRAELPADFMISPILSRSLKGTIDFEVKNRTLKNFFCRSIELNDVRLIEDGMNLLTLNVGVKDVFSPANSVKIFQQNLESDYQFVLDSYPELVPDVTQASLVSDCEVSESRMNKVFIIMKNQGAVGPEKKLVSYFVNMKEQKLVSDNVRNIDIEDKNYIKLYYSNFAVFQNQNDINLLDLSTFKHDLLFRLEGPEELIAALELKSEDSKRVFFVTTNERFEIFAYYLDLKNGVANLIKKEKIYDFFKEVISPIQATIVNFEEFANEAKEIIRPYLKTFSVKKRTIDALGTTQVLIDFLIPSFYSYNTIYDYSAQKLIKPKGVWNKGSSLSEGNVAILVSGESFLVESENVGAKNSVFTDVGIYSHRLANKIVEIKFDHQRIKVNSVLQEFCQSGKCVIENLFSDALIFDDGVSINARLLGRSLLIREVRNENYDEVLKILSLGANVNDKDVMKKTALYYSLSARNYSLTELLLANGADLSLEKGIFGRYLELEVSYLKNTEESEISKFKEKILKMYKLLKQFGYSVKSDSYSHSIVESIFKEFKIPKDWND